jgi:hypothetical protein
MWQYCTSADCMLLLVAIQPGCHPVEAVLEVHSHAKQLNGIVLPAGEFAVVIPT